MYRLRISFDERDAICMNVSCRNKGYRKRHILMTGCAIATGADKSRGHKAYMMKKKLYESMRDLLYMDYKADWQAMEAKHQGNIMKSIISAVKRAKPICAY